jgi:hypothetical protein
MNSPKITIKITSNNNTQENLIVVMAPTTVAMKEVTEAKDSRIITGTRDPKTPITSMATRRATEVTEIHTDITIVKREKLIKHSKSRSHLEKKTNKKLSLITEETRQSNLRSWCNRGQEVNVAEARTREAAGMNREEEAMIIVEEVEGAPIWANNQKKETTWTWRVKERLKIESMKEVSVVFIRIGADSSTLQEASIPNNNSLRTLKNVKKRRLSLSS